MITEQDIFDKRTRKLDPDASMADISAVMRCRLKVLCQLMFPDRFHRELSARHELLFEILDDPSVRKVEVLAHRGFGKTSWVHLGLTAQHALFKLSPYILPLGATSANIVQDTENLKAKLKESGYAKFVLGENIEGPLWTQDEFILSNGVKVHPRSVGQPVRGLLYRDWRPTLITPDDLEEKQYVGSLEYRDKIKHWFFSDVLNSVDRPSPDWRIIVTGTVLHDDSLLELLRADSEWTTVEFPLCDENFKSYWPAFMSDEGVLELKKGLDDNGLVDEFYLEYMNEAHPPEGAKFTSEMFRYYEEADLAKRSDIETVILIDPNRTTGGTTSAYSAVVGAGVDLRANSFYARDIINERITRDELYEAALAMADRLHAIAIGMETTGLKEYIEKPFIDYMLATGRNYTFIDLSAKGGLTDKGKDQRIDALAPYYRTGRVFHNRACCDVLEHQLLRHPKSKFKDVADAFSYIIPMTSVGGRYFSTIFSLPEGSETDDEKRFNEEMRRLRRQFGEPEEEEESEQELIGRLCYG